MAMTIVEQNNMKSVNGNYPIGAQYDPNAPWNEPELKEKEIDVTISITLSKTTKIVVPDIKDLDDSILKEAVKDQVVLPHEIEIIKTISGNSSLDKRVIEDLSGWVVDDFEVIEE